MAAAGFRRREALLERGTAPMGRRAVAAGVLSAGAGRAGGLTAFLGSAPASEKNPFYCSVPPPGSTGAVAAPVLGNAFAPSPF